jgi:hypothetical protein
MIPKTLREFSDSDVSFLVETVDPRLAARLETIRGDASILEGMLEHENERLFKRIMLMPEEELLTRISPRLLFEIVLRRAAEELKTQTYTLERTVSQDIPVFDAGRVAEFTARKVVLPYLADMLASFTRVESFTIPVRVRRGMWRRIRFNDMDIDSLSRFCQAVEREHRFGFYKRMADVCLFIPGIFPEYVYSDYCYPSGALRPQLAGRVRRSAEDYEEEGRILYRLAAEQSEARTAGLEEALWLLHQHFDLARKPLQYASQHWLRFSKRRLFGQGT